MHLFQGWENLFYLLGSAAAGLIGLLFVVATLTRNFERSRALRGAGVYMTPTALHFAVVFAISAVALTPRLPPRAAALLIGVAGIVGLISALKSCVGIRTLMSETEPPHWSDFWCYGAIPLAAHLGLVASAVAIGAGAEWGTYGIAASLLVMLLGGIRNAWDLITWLAPQAKSES